ncbi:hypothetical protein DWV60_16530 [Segatella copri]|jgi:hypothetical protein|uniref:Uncharacterized protein n=1 Tax=Segatella copri TaxID=165179 RepID=A0AA93BFA6_9BACT|nr:hypothetical protein DWV60_16530 [Segatella copri]
MRSHPAKYGEGFDAPPTLERSGSERRGGAVSSLFPEGERVGVRGGALFNGKEGRGDFRKNLLPLRIFVQITLIIMCFIMCVRKQIA